MLDLPARDLHRCPGALQRPDCDGGNESIETVDITGNVGGFAALVLDPGGKPVIVYYHATNGDLRPAST